MTIHKPRVTLVTSALSPTLGLERATLNLVAALEGDLDIQIIAIGGSPADQGLVDGVEILGPPLRGWQRVRSLRRLYYCSRRSNLGTVVLVGVWAALPWLMVARRPAAATAVWEHTLLKEKLVHSRSLQILKFLTQHLYKRADVIVAVSQPVADDLLEYGNIQRVMVIPNIVQASSVERKRIEHQESAPKEKGRRLLCVGSLKAIKAQHLALRALALLDDEYALTVVGAGPEMKSLAELARRLGVENRVEFTGHLDPSGVRQQLSRASLLIHCSVAETFGLVYAEAADAAVPVVSSDTRIAKYMIPEYSPGWLSQPTPEALAETIRKMPWERPIPPEAFVAAAARRAADFGVERVRADWLRLLNNLHVKERR